MRARLRWLWPARLAWCTATGGVLLGRLLQATRSSVVQAAASPHDHMPPALRALASLPGLALEAQHLLRCRPHRVAINCDATRVGVVDFSGTFSFLDTHVSGGHPRGWARVNEACHPHARQHACTDATLQSLTLWLLTRSAWLAPSRQARCIAVLASTNPHANPHTEGHGARGSACTCSCTGPGRRGGAGRLQTGHHRRASRCGAPGGCPTLSLRCTAQRRPAAAACRRMPPLGDCITRSHAPAGVHHSAACKQHSCLRRTPCCARPQDVWDVCWAEDDPSLVALMEKGRMVVLRGGAPEEPVATSAHLAAFRELQVGLGSPLMVARRQSERAAQRAARMFASDQINTLLDGAQHPCRCRPCPPRDLRRCAPSSWMTCSRAPTRQSWLMCWSTTRAACGEALRRPDQPLELPAPRR